MVALALTALAAAFVAPAMRPVALTAPRTPTAASPKMSQLAAPFSFDSTSSTLDGYYGYGSGYGGGMMGGYGMGGYGRGMYGGYGGMCKSARLARTCIRTNFQWILWPTCLRVCGFPLSPYLPRSWWIPSCSTCLLDFLTFFCESSDPSAQTAVAWAATAAMAAMAVACVC